MILIQMSIGLFSPEVIKEIKKVKSCQESKIAIVTTASPVKEQNKFAIKAKNDFIKMGYIAKNVNFHDFDRDNNEELLNRDIIYLNGGNPYYLLYSINKHQVKNIFEKIRQTETLIIGASAGALVMSPSIEVVDYFTPEMNKVALADLISLGLTTDYVFPHYDRFDLFGEEIENKIKMFEENYQVSVIRLKDGDFRLVNA